jgi:hypothetical protein
LTVSAECLAQNQTRQGSLDILEQLAQHASDSLSDEFSVFGNAFGTAL